VQVDAETFVKELMKNVFKQNVDPETVRAVAKKVAAVAHAEHPKRAA
jgi:hypothetical protein